MDNQSSTAIPPATWKEAYRRSSVEMAKWIQIIFASECRRRRIRDGKAAEAKKDALFPALFLSDLRPAHESAYYNKFHTEDKAYQTNNWLQSRAKHALSRNPRTITEIACGNGHFLRSAAAQAERVVGIDFARSPLLDDLPTNVEFRQGDALNIQLPKADLVASADFLEHIEGKNLRALIRKMHQSGTEHYHVIACYDDRHSHVTVVSPGIWLALFQSVDAGYRLIDVDCRRDNTRQIICVISNRPTIATARSVSA